GLASGARVGTSSPRRAALVRALWPRLAVVALRGNVDTRLAKLERHEVDALVLAAAGLRRLGIRPPHVEPCDPRGVVPAIGQGALAPRSRPRRGAQPPAAHQRRPSRLAVGAGGALVGGVGGGCVRGVGGGGAGGGGRLALGGLIAGPGGSRVLRGEAWGAADGGGAVGRGVGGRLLSQGGAELL